METSTHTDGRPMVHAERLEEWRAWLQANHGDSDGVWLVVWKSATGRPTLDYPDTVEVALAHGWVDSRPNRLDDERAMRWFTPRNPRSPWSRINKGKVQRLEEEGRMTDAGRALVEAAKANGSWTVYDEIEELVVPDDLRQALAADSVAEARFAAFPASSRKSILWWIKLAKRPATREKRIRGTAALAARNRMANHPDGRDRGPSPERSGASG